ncbi:GSCFA domain-containing protein [Muricoccus radiodurans]|uniref:GSCFA domain-containing protein n=1 Tax=Muricoccus radiodurans TaxID=2231721 RepID=UPI003CE9D10E
MQHPYKALPDRHFWGRSVSRDFAPEALVAGSAPLVTRGEAVMSAGSCFAANIVPYLERAGFAYVRTEQPHPAFAKIHREALGYHKFSAAYGNLYTTRQLLQLLQRARGTFRPVEDRWHEDGQVIDPFRPGLAFPATSDAEFDALTRQHLDRVLAAVEAADVFVFTLGLTEAWVSGIDGAVFPACPGTVRGRFNPSLHRFQNFRVAEVGADLLEAIRLLRGIRRRLRVILTVSPVPLVATATPDHVLLATTYSKSVLRVAAQEATASLPDITYFPAYEIVTGPQAPWDFFEPDRRDPSRAAIDAVMGAFLSACRGARAAPARPAKAAPAAAPEPGAPPPTSLADLECEEAASAR